MKLFTRNRILSGISAAMAAFIFAPLAFALTNPASFPPRVLQEQTSVHFRKLVNFNDANIGTGVKIGAMPAGAYITGIRCYVVTAFNAATTNNLLIGTAAAGAQLLAGGVTAGTNCVAATTGNQNMSAAPGLGLAVTNTTNTPTGNTGGWDIWVTYTQTGTAATAGQVVFVIDYIANDDQ
jgi:hypothetical protein